MPEFDYTNYGPVYREIPGFAGYRVGTDGSVWSNRGIQLKQSRPKGYCKIALRKRNLFVHVIVLKVFVGPPPTPKHQSCHWNGVRNDNRPCNLRWGTVKSNHADMVRHGTQPTGEDVWNAILTEEQVVQIRERYHNGEHSSELATEFNVSPYSIINVVSGKFWKLAGGPIKAPGAIRGFRVKGYKLSSEDVRKIRDLARSGKNSSEMSRIFGASAGHIRDIVSGRKRKNG